MQLCRLSLPCRDHVPCLVKIIYHAGFAATLLDTAAVLATTAAVLPDAGRCAAAAVPCHGTRPLYRATCRRPTTSPKCGYPAISMDLLFSCAQYTSNKYRDHYNKITRKLFNCVQLGNLFLILRESGKECVHITLWLSQTTGATVKNSRISANASANHWWDFQ